MSNKVLKLKSLYFIVAILVFYIVIVVVSNNILERMPLPSVKTNLIEIEDVKYDNDKIDFVFFHNPDSELSEKMRFEVERLAQKNYENINFYSIDVSKNPVVFYEYNVSGIPNILVFNGEKEIKRIMGLVPYKNLLKIAQRIENEYGELQ